MQLSVPAETKGACGEDNHLTLLYPYLARAAAYRLNHGVSMSVNEHNKDTDLWEVGRGFQGGIEKHVPKRGLS